MFLVIILQNDKNDEAGLKQYTTMTYLYHTIAEVWAQMMRMEDDHDHEDDLTPIPLRMTMS